jgi:hypothetical protein
MSGSLEEIQLARWQFPTGLGNRNEGSEVERVSLASIVEMGG